MLTSINGWTVLVDGSPSLAVGAIPGTTIRLRMNRDVLPLFLALAAEYGRTVATLRAGECGAYAYRQARAAAAWSDHASGTAADLNWGHEGAQGPYGGMHTMSDAQIHACAALKAKYGVVIWGGDSARGGDYGQPKYWDPMHYAIRPGVTVAQVRAQIKSLGIQPDGTVKLIPPPAPYPGRPIGRLSVQRAAVQTMQRALGVRVTGTYLPLLDDGFRTAIGAWGASHPAAYEADGSKPGVIGEHMYASILTRYPTA